MCAGIQVAGLGTVVATETVDVDVVAEVSAAVLNKEVGHRTYRRKIANPGKKVTDMKIFGNEAKGWE